MNPEQIRTGHSIRYFIVSSGRPLTSGKPACVNKA
jgi:hypothetical protein